MDRVNECLIRASTAQEMEDKTDINMTANEIADTITKAATETTSLRREAFTNDHGKAVITSDHTHLVARITPYRKSIQVVAAPIDLEAVATSIPSKATSLSGMRELAAHLDDAIAHVTAAAAAAQRD